MTKNPTHAPVLHAAVHNAPVLNAAVLHAALLVAALLLAVPGCSSDDGESGSLASGAVDAATEPIDGAAVEEDGTAAQRGGTADDGTADDGTADDGTADDGTALADFEPTAEDFVCIKELGHFTGRYWVGNLLGDLQASIDVAESPTGGTFPPGTVIQLVPQEAMVKRAPGWDAQTNDWEFFFLEASADGTTIVTRGAAETENAFGGNCFDCHKKADPQWDMVCGLDHGCDPLRFGESFFLGLQDSDPRCN
jgi:hypothetical protein